MYEEFFTIGDISKLTSIPISTLRYYDKEGIISPTYRDKSNNYRYYSSFQTRVLKIISHLRKLGFSIEYIKSHLENVDYNHTMELMESTIQETKNEIKRLQTVEKELKTGLERIRQLKDLENQIDKPFLEELPEEKGKHFPISTDNISEIRTTIKKIFKFEAEKKIIGNRIVMKSNVQDLLRNSESRESIYFLTDKPKIEHIKFFEKGTYAIIYFRESEEKKALEKLLFFISQKKMNYEDEVFISFSEISDIFGKRDKMISTMKIKIDMKTSP
ncbi:MAG: MerR family transcriptional regulator [Fusobacteriaceae bacterium]